MGEQALGGAPPQAEDARVLRRVSAVPDVFEFVDEDGKNLGWGDWHTDFATKVFLARHSLRWKQSIRVTAERLIAKAVRAYVPRPEGRAS